MKVFIDITVFYYKKAVRSCAHTAGSGVGARMPGAKVYAFLDSSSQCVFGTITGGVYAVILGKVTTEAKICNPLFSVLWPVQ